MAPRLLTSEPGRTEFYATAAEKNDLAVPSAKHITALTEIVMKNISAISMDEEMDPEAMAAAKEIMREIGW